MDKSPDAFRTISEVAELLDTPAHVLRFWESRFPQIKPVKRAGGRRYYRPADMALLAGIRRLLHEEGLTIRGVQKILREQGVRHVSGLSEDEGVAQSVELNVEAEDAEDVTVSKTPIPLFPAPPASETPEAVVPDDAPPEDAPASKGAQGELDRIDEAALQAAIDAPRAQVQQSPDPSEGKQDNSQSEAPKVDAAPEVTVEHAAEASPETSPETSPEPSPDPSPETMTDIAATTPSVPADDVAAKAPSANAGDEKRDAAQPGPESTDTTPAAEPASAPPPIPASLEITGHWLPADLRALRPGAFGAKRPQAQALLQRLEVLRNRVGDLGRVPRR